jgi:penicillin-binding protein 1A
MRKRKVFGIIATTLIVGVTAFYIIRIRPMIKEYKKITYDKLANIDEDTFAKLENTKVYGKDGKLVGEVNSGSYQYKKISEISKYVQDGYIAIEDKNFKAHHGIDYLATARAGIKLVLNRGRATQGGSTITQQLVKNSFLSQQKTFTRKMAEFFLAPEIEKMYTKPQIMEYYCNSNYYGNRCYGIGNAASYYFHKNADQLTLSESALLVGLSNNPSRYDPVTNYDASIKKRNRVLKHMLDTNVISKTQYDQARKEKIEISEYRKDVSPENYQTSFAIYQATLELMKKNGFEFQYTFQDKEDEKKYKERYQEEYQKYFQKLRNGGYKLYTTFDQNCQKALQDSVDHNLRSFTKKKKGKYELQGAAVSIDNETGNIVAVVGGRGQNDQYNRGYLAVRQPGSSIKPLLDYAPAFDSGVYYPSKSVSDRKTSSGPSNSDHSYSGSRTIRNAVIHSTNTVAWNVLQKIGVRNGLKYLTKLQFSNLSYLDNKNASAALGGFTHGVRVVDMAKGFATLENGGVYQDNSCIDHMTFKNEKILMHNKLKKSVYSSASAYMITDCMKDAVKEGTGKNAQVKGQIIAGKTGTTNDSKDAWFCGYSKYYTTSAWVGCDDPKPMEGLTGSAYPSKIFSDYMTKVHKGKEKKDFEMPDTVYRKDGDLFSKDIDDTLHETVLENLLKEQIKKAEKAVEDFEAFTITDGESAYLLDDKYQKVCVAVEKVDDSTEKAKFRQRVEDHYDVLLEEQKKWKDAMETYETQKEQQRLAENEKAEKEAEHQRQIYEQEQNIKLVKSYIARLDARDAYDDTTEDIIQKLQDALKKCEDYDIYEELQQKAEQAIERVRGLSNNTESTQSETD